MKVLRVRNWNETFENNRTREMQRMDWVPVSNRHDTHGFNTIISKADGTALYGAWMLILQVASKCRPRGVLFRAPGIPHNAESIATITRADGRIIQRALDILLEEEIGWLEYAESSELALHSPPATLSTAEEKRRAAGRLDRALRSSAGVMTPAGQVTTRPVTCQWCNLSPAPDAKGVTSIRGHHFLPYGSPAVDRTVIFLCRSCHGFFESGRYTTSMIYERFPLMSPANMAQVTAGDIAGDIAGDRVSPAAPTRAGAGERNGTERNGTESTAESTVHPKQATSESTPPDTLQEVRTPKNNRPVQKSLIPWLRSELHAYVKGGTGVCRSWEEPDDDICLKILVATHGADSNSIERWLQILYRSQQYPELNYAWFETMAEKRFGKTASSVERAGDNPIINGAAGAV